MIRLEDRQNVAQHIEQAHTEALGSNPPVASPALTLEPCKGGKPSMASCWATSARQPFIRVPRMHSQMTSARPF
jgi:hypothetical protein